MKNEVRQSRPYVGCGIKNARPVISPKKYHQPLVPTAKLSTVQMAEASTMERLRELGRVGNGR
jgi:hypothetical protein